MEIIKEWWPIIIAAIGFIIWIIRFEAKIVTQNKLFEMHQQTCINRHKTENDLATKNNEDMKKALDTLFDITRDLGNCLNKLNGFMDGITKK